MRWFPFSLALVALAPLPACSDAAAQETVMRETPCGELFPDASGNGWASAPWGPTEAGCWIEFGGDQRVILTHDLGRVPNSLEIYISFDSLGRSAAPSAGDTAVIEEVGADTLTLRNNTRQDFYLRVVAR